MSDKQWRSTSGSRANVPSPTDPHTNTMRNRETFIGRVVIDVYTPTDPSEDGIEYTVTMANSTTPEQTRAFFRDVIQKLYQK